MSAQPEQRAEAARWLAYAREDLEAAQALVADGQPFRLVCTLAQQSAEKALKAGFVFAGVEPPRTHNLGRLRSDLGSEWGVGDLQVSLGELSEWAVASRYPGNWEEPTEDDASRALSAADAILEVMTRDLLSRGL